MYLTARGWGIQPSEFWAMTLSEYMLELEARYRETPQGRHELKREQWLADAELTDEEWRAKYGATKD